MSTQSIHLSQWLTDLNSLCDSRLGWPRSVCKGLYKIIRSILLPDKICQNAVKQFDQFVLFTTTVPTCFGFNTWTLWSRISIRSESDCNLDCWLASALDDSPMISSANCVNDASWRITFASVWFVRSFSEVEFMPKYDTTVKFKW